MKSKVFLISAALLLFFSLLSNLVQSELTNRQLRAHIELLKQSCEVK